MSAPLSVLLTVETGTDKSCRHTEAQLVLGKAMWPLSLQEVRRTSIRAQCRIYTRVVISGVNWTCCAFDRVGDDVRLSCWPERRGQGQGLGWMMYPCSKGMCHSWPGAYSQRWRWMPGGEIQRTKWSVGGREGKEPGVHLVAVLSSSSSIFGGLRSPGKHRHEAYIVPHYHIYCS